MRNAPDTRTPNFPLLMNRAKELPCSRQPRREYIFTRRAEVPHRQEEMPMGDFSIIRASRA